MYKLYDIVYTQKKDREKLYYHTIGKVDLTSEGLAVDSGTSIDFLTYFNCFSLCQWKKYTTIKSLKISGKIIGQGQLEIYSIGENSGCIDKIPVNGNFEKTLSICETKGEILGLRFCAKTPCTIQGISYLGEFECWNDLKVGVTICTYKREEYVKVTMTKLLEFSKTHHWLTTLIIDNGSTLPEFSEDSLRIVHNPNFGGSGGFTRGILENLKSKTNDYVLLMDDDIDLETSALEHMYGILCSLKDEYKDSFLSGAMLKMQLPCIQHENTAYWGKIRLHSLGKGWNLAKQEVLLDNEHISDCDNQYGAWWFCCIPLKRVEKIGLPLPVFIKGDDIEYGLRNERKLIHMNGIGVWHEAFEGKQALWVNYYAYRNFFIMNQYAKGCNRWTLMAMTCGRMAVHFLKGHFNETKVLKLALKDAIGGFEDITAIPADEKLQQIRQFNGECSYLSSVIEIICIITKCFFDYNQINRKYRLFRKEYLMDNRFWLEYLNKI